MSIAPSVASVIAKPDIVALSSHDESRSYIRAVKDPKHMVSLKSMLKQNNRLFRVFLFTQFAWDSLDIENVTILSEDLVTLSFKALSVRELF